MKTEIIPEEIRKFLETEEGKAIFAEITKSHGENITRQNVYDRRQSFLNPSPYVVRWVDTLERLKKFYKKVKKSKK